MAERSASKLQFWSGCSSGGSERWQQPGDPETIYPARLLWVLGNFSRFVCPGMQRVEIAGANHNIRGLMASAFKDDRSRRVVTVYINIGEADRQVALNFLTAGGQRRPTSITPYITSDASGDELRRGPQFPADASISISAKSVVTLVSDFG